MKWWCRHYWCQNTQISKQYSRVPFGFNTSYVCLQTVTFSVYLLDINTEKLQIISILVRIFNVVFHDLLAKRVSVNKRHHMLLSSVTKDSFTFTFVLVVQLSSNVSFVTSFKRNKCDNVTNMQNRSLVERLTDALSTDQPWRTLPFCSDPVYFICWPVWPDVQCKSQQCKIHQVF